LKPAPSSKFFSLSVDSPLENPLKCWKGAYRMVGGDSVVHLSGLVLLARALATGEATVILQAFQNESFASKLARE